MWLWREARYTKCVVSFHFCLWRGIVACWNCLSSNSDRGHRDLSLWWPCDIWHTAFTFPSNSWAWSSRYCGECWARSNFCQTRYETAVDTSPVLSFQALYKSKMMCLSCRGEVPTLRFFQGVLKGTTCCSHLSVVPVLIYFQVFCSISLGFWQEHLQLAFHLHHRVTDCLLSVIGNQFLVYTANLSEEQGKATHWAASESNL